MKLFYYRDFKWVFIINIDEKISVIELLKIINNKTGYEGTHNFRIIDDKGQIIDKKNIFNNISFYH